MERNKIIELKGITKSFDGETVLRDIDLDIYDNEFMTLLGPSGCGKTTTLRIIGGFETPDAGDVFFDGKRINDVPPHKREVNTVFQQLQKLEIQPTEHNLKILLVANQYLREVYQGLKEQAEK